MTQKTRDTLSGGTLLLLGAIMFATSFSIPRGAEIGVGAGFMPGLMSILLALAGLALALRGWTSAEPEPAGEKPAPNYRAVALSLLYLGLFVALLTRLGFVITTFAYIFLQTALFRPRDKKDYKTIAIVAVVATIGIYLVFARGFRILLPAGILG